VEKGAHLLCAQRCVVRRSLARRGGDSSLVGCFERRTSRAGRSGGHIADTRKKAESARPVLADEKNKILAVERRAEEVKEHDAARPPGAEDESEEARDGAVVLGAAVKIAAPVAPGRGVRRAVGLALFRRYVLQSKHHFLSDDSQYSPSPGSDNPGTACGRKTPVDDGRYGPCNQSDTREWSDDPPSGYLVFSTTIILANKHIITQTNFNCPIAVSSLVRVAARTPGCRIGLHGPYRLSPTGTVGRVPC
jgi:hypothetical protein